MKQFSNFEEAKKSAEYSGSSQVPAGAYVCKIKNVQYQAGQNGNSDLINILFDVAEGEHKDFYKNQYENNPNEDKKWKGRTSIWVPSDDGSEKDGWTKTAFARWTNAFENSNKGYAWDWDENKWKGLKIGLVFGPTGAVIDGKSVVFNEVHGCCSVDDVKNDTFNKKLLEQKDRAGFNPNAIEKPTSSADSDGFMDADAEEVEVPF